MNFPLFEDVILQVDLPEEGVLAGDIGVVVERHDVPELETGYSVEFFNMSGDTMVVVTVAGSKLRLPIAADLPMVRQFHAPRTMQAVPLAV